ncbi:MAG: ROK family protein, partial [Verrucomicrobiota bacterium]
MLIEPSFVPPLDPAFQPAVLASHCYLAAARKTGQAVPLVIGLERERGLVSRYETCVFPAADAATLRYVERTVKFLLWARGGWKIIIGGPKPVGEFIRKTYSPAGARKFDFDLMGAAYGKELQVVVTAPEKVPAHREMEVAAGGHLKGCRIGFDLGASDYKVSAVVDGKAIFTEEAPWDP